MVAAAARRPTELVPFDPFRHLKSVAELIARAFAGELGPGARRTLRQMRRMARWGWVGLSLWGAEARFLRAPGFVWLEDGEVVGNVSLRRAAYAGGWMIGNVVVHPDWQGQGIGRTLTEAAVEAAGERGGAWVGLEVREDNAVARGLYERMGFEAVGSSVELGRPAGAPWLQVQSPISLRRAGAADGRVLYQLAQAGLSRPHREVLEIRRSVYRAGWEARLAALLEGCRANWWVRQEGGRIVGALRVSSRWPDCWHEVEILVRDEQLGRLGSRLAEAALAYLAQRRSWEATTTLPGPREALEAVFTEAGFRRIRRLLQMRMILGKRVGTFR
ncbi:MAG: GNAT family N-acetyltransferase [Anaerolineae bacterium]|jgi:ribosomal protein S18 acetylase RimI-like enzyme